VVRMQWDAQSTGLAVPAMRAWNLTCVDAAVMAKTSIKLGVQREDSSDYAYFADLVKCLQACTVSYWRDEKMTAS
jgi:hypothetical protein